MKNIFNKIKLLLLICFIYIFFIPNVNSEIRNFNCNFKSEKYDLSFVNSEYQFNLENAELIAVDGIKMEKGPTSKEGIEVDISNGNIALDVSPNSNVTGHLFINLINGAAEVFFYKIDDQMNTALINYMRKTSSKNVKENKPILYKLIHLANDFIQENYPENLIFKIDGQC